MEVCSSVKSSGLHSDDKDNLTLEGKDFKNKIQVKISYSEEPGKDSLLLEIRYFNLEKMESNES